MLLLEGIHQVHQHTVLAKAREQIILFQFLVIFLDEGANDLGGISN